jgi:hypothetical protein
MPQTDTIAVQKLKLDLHNFRTMVQPDEVHAVQSIVAIEPEEFWVLMESLLEADGYLLTENILVLKSSDDPSADLIVKEGNRRVAALKLIHGYLPSNIVTIPSHIAAKIAARPAAWNAANEAVPCAIYGPSEAATVDRIVTLAHGKGEKAGRSGWRAVARARHNRDRGNPEPALDLLDKYLAAGTNLTQQQKDRWAGVYNITVLEEAMKKLASRLGATNAPDLAKKYPNILHRNEFEEILKAIGLEQIKFTTIRQGGDFAAKYGLPAQTTTSGGGASPGAGQPTGTASSTASGAGNSGTTASTSQSQGASGSSGSAQPGPASGTPTKKTAAVASNDPRAVRRLLKQFTPKGQGREKLMLLLNEARQLDVRSTPLAFSFVLRSLFEVSAHVYCGEHGIPTKNPKGYNRTLSDLLGDVVAHLTNNGQNKVMQNELHGALAVLQNKDGILSVTSLNQLVHSKTFSIAPGDLCILFGNIFPLLVAMNS